MISSVSGGRKLAVGSKADQRLAGNFPCLLFKNFLAQALVDHSIR